MKFHSRHYSEQNSAILTMEIIRNLFQENGGYLKVQTKTPVVQQWFCGATVILIKRGVGGVNNRLFMAYQKCR
jgi:hypothetical protein